MAPLQDMDSPKKRQLMQQAGLGTSLDLSDGGEDVWIEVIQKMDAVYAELVESQVELERKNMALEDAQKFIESVLSSMTDVLIVCDRQGNIQQVNSALENLTGHREQALIGRPLSFVFADDHKDSITRIPDRIRADKTITDRELSVLDVAGAALPLSVNCSGRYDYKGHLVGMVLIGRPVGELRQAYEKLDNAHHTLRQAQQRLIFSEKMAALGRLVAGVAHELNNPISFVYGNMHALKNYGENITRFLKETEGGHAAKKLRDELHIDRIAGDILPLVEGTLEGAERISDIVQELRRFSGSQKEAIEELTLMPVLETAVNWVMRGAKTSPRITIDCPSEMRVFARKGHIHQIIVNLVQNAIDVLGSRPDDKITISCERRTDHVDVLVQDNGDGIADKDIDHIFEPFYTTKPIGQGTGLGLYVSYNMAEEFGGSLAGKNLEEGGALFTLTLPATGENK